MTEKLPGVLAVKPSTTTERKWISAEAAKEASKRALDRLKDRIVDSLNLKLESLVLQNREPGDSVEIFKQALNDPTVTNVRLAQTLLRRDYPTVAIDGQLGPQTLSAMDKLITILADRARISTDIMPVPSWESEGSVATPGATNGNDSLVKPAPISDPKPASSNWQKSPKQNTKLDAPVRGSIVQGPVLAVNEDSF